MMQILTEEHGPIVAIRVPGKEIMVIVTDPEDVQTVMSSGEKTPIEPGFDFFVTYRREMRKDLYPETGGLLGSHGEDWYEVRSKVQQDMMRPKSALFYIDGVTQVSDDLLELIESKLDGAGYLDDATIYVYRWALDAVGAIFLDSRLGCLEEPMPTLASGMISSVDVALGQ